MFKRAAVVYEYDGSFEGLLCCVFESFVKKELPEGIIPQDAAQGMLYEKRRIATEQHLANRVLKGVVKEIGYEARYLITRGFFTCMEQKELYITMFLQKGFKIGSKVVHMLADDVVGPLTKAVKFLEMEGHKYCGFVRFTDYGEVLVSTIAPKNYVLPVIASHFCDRFANEAFMIYDKTHKAALLYQRGQREIVPLEEIHLPQINAEEQFYRKLWREFYKTIGIKGRYNPRCRMNFMPKRYWPELTEFQQDETSALPQGNFN